MNTVDSKCYGLSETVTRCFRKFLIVFGENQRRRFAGVCFSFQTEGYDQLCFDRGKIEMFIFRCFPRFRSSKMALIQWFFSDFKRKNINSILYPCADFGLI